MKLCSARPGTGRVGGGRRKVRKLQDVGKAAERGGRGWRRFWFWDRFGDLGVPKTVKIWGSQNRF